MPLNIDPQKKLVTKTDRVKQIAFHATENWAATALYNGQLAIYDYVSGNPVSHFQSSEHPLRCCAFISSRKLVVTAGDDLMMRAYHLGSQHKIMEKEAHSDYIRSMAVSPDERWLITSSDDSTIKLWDIEKDFELKTTYEGHSHYVMQVAWHRESQKFVSASLDKTLSVWGLDQKDFVRRPLYSLKGHSKSVNCCAFSPSGEIIVSGGDDFIAVWDINTRQILHKLDGHSAAVNAVAFHPVYPLIISGGEDALIRCWNTRSYAKENAYQFHMNRIWSIAPKGEGSCIIGIGADTGCAVLELGKNQMIHSHHRGKIVYCKQNSVFTCNLKAKADTGPLEDGSIVEVTAKELGTTDVFAESCAHSSNGTSVAICGETEYAIYTSLKLNAQKFGRADRFVWGLDRDYATLESKDNAAQCSIKIHDKEFNEVHNIRPDSTVSQVFGGKFLAAVLESCCTLNFYDWASGELVRAIEVSNVQNVVWSPNNDTVAIVTYGETFILTLNEEAFDGEYDPEEGFVDLLDTAGDIHDSIDSLCWIQTPIMGDSCCLAFLTSTNKLNIWIHGHLETIAFCGTSLSLVAYSESDQALVLIDRKYNVCFYNCSQHWLAYHLRALEENWVDADALFEKIPESYHNKLAKFLDAEGNKQKALSITKDNDHRLKLALELDDLKLAAKVLEEVKSKDPTSLPLQSQWQALGDAALTSGDVELAGTCFVEAKDYTAALMVYSSLGNTSAMELLADLAVKDGQLQVAIYTLIHLNAEPEKIVDLYLSTGKPALAATFARTYDPRLLPKCTAAWEKQLGPRFKVQCDPVPVVAPIRTPEPIVPEAVIPAPEEAPAPGEEEEAVSSRAETPNQESPLMSVEEDASAKLSAQAATEEFYDVDEAIEIEAEANLI